MTTVRARPPPGNCGPLGRKSWKPARSAGLDSRSQYQSYAQRGSRFGHAQLRRGRVRGTLGRSVAWAGESWHKFRLIHNCAACHQVQLAIAITGTHHVRRSSASPGTGPESGDRAQVLSPASRPSPVASAAGRHGGRPSGRRQSYPAPVHLPFAPAGTRHSAPPPSRTSAASPARSSPVPRTRRQGFTSVQSKMSSAFHQRTRRERSTCLRAHLVRGGTRPSWRTLPALSSWTRKWQASPERLGALSLCSSFEGRPTTSHPPPLRGPRT